MNELKQQFANFSLMGPGFNGFDSIEDRSLLEPTRWCLFQPRGASASEHHGEKLTVMAGKKMANTQGDRSTVMFNSVGVI